MLFGKRNKNKPAERVLDLKARVDALRAADQASRKEPYSLDDFLEGDDVKTGRAVADDYKPRGFDPAAPAPAAGNPFEVNLQAELDKFIQRQEQAERAAAAEASAAESRPKRAPEPESQSFLQDGTWSHDDLPPRTPSGSADLGAAQRPNAPPWPAGFEPVAGSAPDGDGEGAWPNSRAWPEEEPWPPREEAV